MRRTGITLGIYNEQYITKNHMDQKLPSDTERHSKNSVVDTVSTGDGTCLHVY